MSNHHALIPRIFFNSSLSPIIKNSRMDKEMKQLINETLASFVGIGKIGIFINLSVTFVQVLRFWCFCACDWNKH